MAYDCTFHLVDERAIREQFVPRLLLRTSAPTPADSVMKDAAAWWESARGELNSLEPKAAAVALCNRALDFSACSLPYRYERGMALSLWDRQEWSNGRDFPRRFEFSPQPLFEELLGVRPELRGMFPVRFCANFMTGVFIPSDRIEDVLRWADAQLKSRTKREQRNARPLLDVLAAAAERGLAFWEATDLVIPFMNVGVGDPDLMSADFGKWKPKPHVEEKDAVTLTPAPGQSWEVCIIGSILVSSTAKPFITRAWDLDVWPPRHLGSTPAFGRSFGVGRNGAWAGLLETDESRAPRNFLPYVAAGWDAGPQELPDVVIGDGSLECDSITFLGKHPLVFLAPPADVCRAGDFYEPPRVYIDGRWRALAGLDRIPTRSSVSNQLADSPVCAAHRLRSGTTLVVWDGDGYEAVGDRYQCTFPMGARAGDNPWSPIELHDDALFYLSNRRLYEMRRGHDAVQHAVKCRNIMHIRRGPTGSLLLHEGTNDDADVAKLYFPGEQTIAHLEPELFGGLEHPHVYWSEHTDRCVALAEETCVGVPSSTLLALPRYHAKMGARAR